MVGLEVVGRATPHAAPIPRDHRPGERLVAPVRATRGARVALDELAAAKTADHSREKSCQAGSVLSIPRS